MSYKTILDSISDSIERLIEDITDATEIPTNDYGWKNKRYISDYFRIAHIERYSDRTNERTMNVLKAKLGEERAREFMETILFPKIILH